MKRTLLMSLLVGFLAGGVMAQDAGRDPFATGEGGGLQAPGAGGADPFADGGGGGGGGPSDPFADGGDGGNRRGNAGGYDPTDDPFADPDAVRRHRNAQLAKKVGEGGAKREADAGVFVVDTIEVPQAKLRAYAMSEGIGSNSEALWKVVQGWVDEGVAARVEMTALTVSGNQWGEMSGGREMIYPTEFQPDPVSPKPTAFETRITGYRFQATNVGTTKGGLKSSSSSELVRYVGEAGFVGGDPKYTEGTIRMPIFESIRASSDGVMLRDGKPILLDARTTLGEGGRPDAKTSVMVFLRAASLDLPAKGKVAPEASGVMTLLWVDVDAAVLGEWLGENGVGAAGYGLWGAVEGWLEGGEAVDVDLEVLPVSRGKVAQGESVLEFVYPTEWDPPVEREEPSMAVGFETRNLGSSFEVGSFGQGPVAFFQITAGLVAHAGESVHRYRPDGDGRAVDVTMPIIANVQLMTQLDEAYLLGGTLMLGLGTPVGDDGELDRGRKLVLFGKLTP